MAHTVAACLNMWKTGMKMQMLRPRAFFRKPSIKYPYFSLKALCLDLVYIFEIKSGLVVPYILCSSKGGSVSS